MHLCWSYKHEMHDAIVHTYAHGNLCERKTQSAREKCSPNNKHLTLYFHVRAVAEGLSG